MAKFYVQSGSFKGIVDSFDAECAAVWAVHRVMSRFDEIAESDVDSAPLSPEIDSEDADDENDAMGLFALDDDILVSERGFSGLDSQWIPTHHAVLRWVQLSHAVRTLTDKMNKAFGEL